ncbi:MAG: hypothetical protein KDD21_12085 [Bacteroidetes bacterium]|nr:hypothetical protein [Bacteroidota bacterium]
MKKQIIIIVLLLFSCIAFNACHKGMGCPADQYNDWKKIEAMRKQQLKSPNNPNGKKSKSRKAKVEGNGVVP